MKLPMRTLAHSMLKMGIGVGIVYLSLPMAWAAQTELADLPVSSAPPSPVNLLLTPSVEFPTATVYSHKDGSYVVSKEYLGYFDPNKCYSYNTSAKYFEAVSKAENNHRCSGNWSGNALNYATMSGIDPFRWALTGGYRDIDTASTNNSPNGRGVTVLQRSYQNSRSQMGARTIPGPSGNVTVNNAGQGLNVTIAGKTYLARARVCDDRKGVGYLESNCTAYATSNGIVTYKPTGLIQRYQDKMRFGVFGYLFNEYNPDTQPILNGGVMRGRLKNVGPTKWDGTNNPANEWSPTTGVYVANPDTADAAASGVSNSGVINYLNEFGFASKGYEIYDQPGEMVAEALRYLMRIPATAAYYQRANDDPRRKDGFPAISNWEDPIINGCQKNAILGIGDVNSHYEDNFGQLPFDPKVWAAKMNSPEGTSGLQNMRWGNGGSQGGSNMIAGIAYYAHTQDIRPDLSKQEKMTVETFWVDVMEPSGRGVSGHNEYVHKNQYWLAAKYGGFKDANKNNSFETSDTWKMQGRKYFGNDLPDNYYPASEASAMVAGLESAFSQINSLVITGSGAGVAWQNAGDTIGVYGGDYDTTHWSGDVTGKNFDSFNADGTARTTQVWSAATKIDAQNWDSGRRIVTGKIENGAFNAVPFRLNQLSAAQAITLDADPIKRQAILNYLRGNRTGEDSIFRKRDHVLGDIVHSKPTYVGMPNAHYLETFNPGYAAFQEKYKDRMEMVYVGANDGMLHAIKAAVTGPAAPHGGEELWAYIPSPLYSGPGNPAIPEVNGLRALALSSYTHRYYIDATPIFADVDFNRAGTPGTSSTTSDWRTLLVGGLGKGGKAYFALDITDPGAISTEDNAASKVLWEFAPPDLGFSFGQALIVKTKAWGWVVLIPSGYNNASGKGILYIVNARTGALIKSIETGAGSINEPAGFAQIEAFIPTEGEFVASQVYGGDLLGNFWRFDLSDEKGDVKVHKLAQLTDERGNPQPVTIYPTMRRPAEGAIDHRWVFIATGQLLSPSDITGGSGTRTQTMYAIRDGGRYETEPDSALPLTRNDLEQLTNLKTGLLDAPEKGWYYDMPGVLNGAKERVWAPMVTAPDVISWTGVMPTVPADACSNFALSGKSTVYAVNLETGTSALTVNGNIVASASVNALVVDTQIVRNKEGRAQIVVQRMSSSGTGDEKGPETLPDVALKGPPEVVPGVINWRIAK